MATQRFEGLSAAAKAECIELIRVARKAAAALAKAADTAEKAEQELAERLIEHARKGGVTTKAGSRRK